MLMKRRLAGLATVLVTLGLVTIVSSASASAPICQSSDPFCYEPQAAELAEIIRKVEMPRLAVPIWLGAN